MGTQAPSPASVAGLILLLAASVYSQNPMNPIFVNNPNANNPNTQQIVNQIPPNNNQVCRRTLDLVFAVDSSNSLGPQNFNTMMTTLNRAVDVLQFGPDMVRAGAVSFSTTTDVVGLQTDKTVFQQRIQQLVYRDEGSNADQGIREATRILSANRRPNVPIALLIVTDGRLANNAATLAARQAAVAAGVDIWTVGVGAQINDAELLELAITSNQAFRIETFNRVPDQLVSLTRIVCEQATFFPGPQPVTPPPPVNPTTNPLEDLCRQSPVFEGVRYVTYPNDCTRVLQCYQNEATGKFLLVTRRCPTGQFWDQDAIECRDSYLVDCPYDLCKSCDMNPRTDTALTFMSDGTATYAADGGQCGGYWECRGGKSYPACCPPLNRYVSGSGCQQTNDCFGVCTLNGTCASGTGPCYKYPDWQQPTTYLPSTRLGATFGSRSGCLYGGQFDVLRCQCTDREMDILMRTPQTACQMFYQSAGATQCGQNQAIQIPPTQGSTVVGSRGPLTLRFTIQLNQPGFVVRMTSQGQVGQPQVVLTVTGDNDGISGRLDTVAQSLSGNSTALFLDATGTLDVFLMYSNNLLTLSVTQNTVTHVAMAEVSGVELCTNCQLQLSTSATGAGCSIPNVQVFGCEPDVLFNVKF